MFIPQSHNPPSSTICICFSGLGYDNLLTVIDSRSDSRQGNQEPLPYSVLTSAKRFDNSQRGLRSRVLPYWLTNSVPLLIKSRVFTREGPANYRMPCQCRACALDSAKGNRAMILITVLFYTRAAQSVVLRIKTLLLLTHRVEPQYRNPRSLVQHVFLQMRRGRYRFPPARDKPSFLCGCKPTAPRDLLTSSDSTDHHTSVSCACRTNCESRTPIVDLESLDSCQFVRVVQNWQFIKITNSFLIRSSQNCLHPSR